MHLCHVTHSRFQLSDSREPLRLVRASSYKRDPTSAVPTQNRAIVLPSSRPPHKQEKFRKDTPARLLLSSGLQVLVATKYSSQLQGLGQSRNHLRSRAYRFVEAALRVGPWCEGFENLQKKYHLGSAISSQSTRGCRSGH